MPLVYILIHFTIHKGCCVSSDLNESRLRSLLATGAKRPAEIQASLGISQPTLSRLIRKAGDGVLSFGATRATLYALAKNIPEVGSAIPIFQVDRTGDVRPFGTLHTLAASQYFWEPVEGKSQLYDYLPWFVQALRPDGFLGRAFAHKHHGAGLPIRLEDWNDQHLLTAMCRFGLDSPGNLILGKEAVHAYLVAARRPLEILAPRDREEFYPRLAQDSMAGSPPGSSAGGEQPKFGAILDDGGLRHVLVKFSPPITKPEGRRWADLLVCEHLALQTMTEAGKPAATSRIFECGDRVFLEVDRFDRIGKFGRRGVVSLGVLEDEFFGIRDNWISSAQRFEKQGMLSPEEVSTVRWQAAFSSLIANTDQHFGNLSLLVEADGQFRLAPGYDVLPMFYRPTASGEILDRDYTIPSIAGEQEWDDARMWAGRYWEKVSLESRISEPFRVIARRHIEQLEELLDDGPRLIM